ncbi:MAG: hypothetical protein ACI8Q1_001363 [Parvicella sp.]|jgi:hypothetical protein
MGRIERDVDGNQALIKMPSLGNTWRRPSTKKNKKMKRLLLISLAIIAFHTTSGQQKTEFDIKYNGEPFEIFANEKECIQTIFINDTQIEDSIIGSSVKIDMKRLKINKYDDFHLEIIHLSSCSARPQTPSIINKYCLQPDSLIYIDSLKSIYWTCKNQIVPEIFTVEKLTGKKWTKINTISGFEKQYQFILAEENLSKGKNTFRVTTRQQLINHNCSTNSVVVEI